MARGLNGSANGSSHGTDHQEGVEARRPTMAAAPSTASPFTSAASPTRSTKSSARSCSPMVIHTPTVPPDSVA